MKKFIHSEGFFHFLFALIIIPFQNGFPELLKIIFIPYVFFLVYQRSISYYPALIALITPATTIMFATLISVFIVVLFNLKEIKSGGLINLLVLSLLPAPVLLYMTYIRYSEFNLGLIDLLKPLDYYLGIFTFFWGYISSKNLKIETFNNFIISLLLISLFMLFPIIDFSIRVYWLIYPVIICFVFGSLFFSKKNGKSFALLFFWVFFLILFGTPKFTVFFSGIIGCILIILKFQKLKILLKVIAGQSLIFLFIIVLSYFIFKKNNFDSSFIINNYEDISNNYYDSWRLFNESVSYKLLSDRVPLWVGGFNSLLANDQYYFFPPFEPLKYVQMDLANNIEIDSEIPIHNLLLELMRNFGVFFGGLIFYIFFRFMFIGPGKFLINSNLTYDKLIYFASGTLGCAILGSLVGQFPLMASFSFSILSIWGIYYRIINHKQFNFEKG